MCEGLGLRTNGAFVEFTVSQPLPVRRPHTLAYLDRPPALLRAAAPPPPPVRWRGERACVQKEGQMPSVSGGLCFARAHVAGGKAREVRGLEAWPWAPSPCRARVCCDRLVGREPRGPLRSLP